LFEAGFFLGGDKVRGGDLVVWFLWGGWVVFCFCFFLGCGWVLVGGGCCLCFVVWWGGGGGVGVFFFFFFFVLWVL